MHDFRSISRNSSNTYVSLKRKNNMIIFGAFLSAIFFISSSLGAEQEKKEDECASVFYPIVKPLLRYFDECREKDAQRSQCQDKYRDLENKYVEVQGEYSLLLKKHTEILYELNEINTKYERLKSINLDFENLQAQLNQKVVHIDALTDHIVVLKKTMDLETVTSELREEIEKIRKIETSKEMSKNQMDNSNNRSNNSENKNSNVPALPSPCSPTQNKTWVIQEIQLPGLEPFKVGCYLDDGAGPAWMIVFHKFAHSKKFNQTFKEYTNGFGHVGSSLNNEFFVGLERLHRLTDKNPHEFLIFANSAKISYKERCRYFVLGNKSSGYRTQIVDWCHTKPGKKKLGVLMQGIKFSTFDRDADEDSNRNWAKEKGFGWWWPSSTVSNDTSFLWPYVERTIILGIRAPLIDYNSLP